ncbi:good for full DBP5 activity protein 2 [Cladorrhinum sp. PSN259]|nr:good for full DBP5 activity protein 2 [Cladorrhinum sp. PSN259]
MDDTIPGQPQDDLERQREEDAQFMRDLIALTRCDPAIFDGFDPSSWRDVDPSELAEGEEDMADMPVDPNDETGGLIPTPHMMWKTESSRSTKPNKARRLAADVPDDLLDPAELEKEGLQWKETGLAVGEASLETQTFVPWKLVINYCNMFVGKVNGERAAPLFTLEALHHNRIWDLYYLHQPKQLGDHLPVLFVPTGQFEHLLDVVNAKLQINLTIPPGSNARKFNLLFGTGNGPRPRFLGRSSSAEQFNSLRENIPEPKDEDDLNNATQDGRETLLDILQMISKASSKAKQSDKNRYKRTQSHRDWGKAMKRAQRYLGLRENTSERAPGGTEVEPQMLDLNQPMTIKPEGSVLFVCIDIEAYEFNQELITEVGISVLDTTRLVGVAPGVNGQNWFPLIESRHIRIEENIWAVNRKYVQGCADRFDFGNTEFIKEKEIAKVVEEIIDHARFGPAGLNPEPRPVVLVFHDSSADIKYLEKCGYNVYAADNVIDMMDTKDMHQYTLRTNNPGSLEKALGYLGIPCKNLHNAGNDAAYTLRAMLGLAVMKRIKSLERALSGELKGHIPYAEFQEKEGWTSGGEDTDGGKPVKPR